MNKIYILGLSFVCTIFGLSTLSSCTSDEVPEPDQLTLCDTISATYDATVKNIIDSKCAVSGCHANNQSPLLVDYTQVEASSGRIITRAVEQQTMPPSGMPQLSNEEIDVLNCWEDAGFPEN